MKDNNNNRIDIKKHQSEKERISNVIRLKVPILEDRLAEYEKECGREYPGVRERLLYLRRKYIGD